MGLGSIQGKIRHLGTKMAPNKSTLANANMRRDPKVFEKTFYSLLSLDQNLVESGRFLYRRKEIYFFPSSNMKRKDFLLRLRFQQGRKLSNAQPVESRFGDEKGYDSFLFVNHKAGLEPNNDWGHQPGAMPVPNFAFWF